jgi:hypothetical protein
MTYDVGNPGSGLGQAQSCDGIKTVCSNKRLKWFVKQNTKYTTQSDKELNTLLNDKTNIAAQHRNLFIWTTS